MSRRAFNENEFSRRGFLKRTITGAVAAAVTASVVSERVLNLFIATGITSGGILTMWNSGRPVRERTEAIDDSSLFRDRLRRWINRYEGMTGPPPEGAPYPKPGTDLAVAMENSKEMVFGIPARTRLQLVREKIMDGEGAEYIPNDIRDEIRFLISGIAAQESRFRNDRTSSAGARHMLQIMPETYKGLGYTNITIQNPRNQVECARRHFGMIYTHLQHEAGDALATIKERYFKGDEATFNRQFLALAMVDAYHAGQGLTTLMIKKLAAGSLQIPSFVRSYDVFSALAHAAAESGSIRILQTVHTPDGPKTVVSVYGNASATYVEGAYAFALLVNSVP